MIYWGFIFCVCLKFSIKKLKKLGEENKQTKKTQLEDNTNAGRVNNKKKKIITTLLGINSLQSKSKDESNCS